MESMTLGKGVHLSQSRHSTLCFFPLYTLFHLSATSQYNYFSTMSIVVTSNNKRAILLYEPLKR